MEQRPHKRYRTRACRQQASLWRRPAATYQQGLEVRPTVAAVELAVRGEQPDGTEVLEEAIRDAACVAEEEHRRHRAGEEALGDGRDELPAEATAVRFAEHIDLVELTGVARHAPIVRPSGGKAKQASGGVAEADNESIGLRRTDRLGPLRQAQGERGAAVVRGVCLVERLHVHGGQCRYIRRAQVTEYAFQGVAPVAITLASAAATPVRCGRAAAATIAWPSAASLVMRRPR
jgi:hypothetical protein